LKFFCKLGFDICAAVSHELHRRNLCIRCVHQQAVSYSWQCQTHATTMLLLKPTPPYNISSKLPPARALNCYFSLKKQL
jgi:hypothetical protein